MFGSGFSEACLVSEKDPRRAGGKRGLFSSAFSAKALMEQEIVLQRYINSFVSKVGYLGSEASGINMVKWYGMVSFNILGEMAFGESFNCIEKGRFNLLPFSLSIARADQVYLRVIPFLA